MVGIPGFDVPDLTPQVVDDAADWTGNAAKDSAGFVGDRVDDVGDGLAGLGGFVAKTAEGGWDLIEDEFEEIKAEAERGLAWLKDKAAVIADYATNPVGDSASLRTSAGAWAAVAEALGRERESLEGGKPGLAGAWKGPNGDSYLDGVSAASDAMGDVAEQALKVQKLLERGADTIDELNKQVQLLVVEILATITLTAVIGLITGGGGLVLGGARVAAVVTKVGSLVTTARVALRALRVAQVVRLSAIGYKLRKTAELTRRGRQALEGASKLVKFSKAASVTKFGGRVRRTRRAISPFSNQQRRLSFAASTVSGAIGQVLNKDPRDWTAEDIAKIVAGGYINATAGAKLTELLKKGKLGSGGAAVVQGALFSAGIDASSQAAFHKGKIDWTRVGGSAAMGGFGAAVGGGSVRRRLKPEKLSAARKEGINFAGNIVAIPAGKRISDRGKRLGKDLDRAGKGDRRIKPIVVPKIRGLDLPTAPILHKIRPGQSLSSIAGARLDDPNVWRRIRRANPGLVDPDLIHPGDRVAIPRDLGFRLAG